jgi:hypothetical protein
MVVPGKMRDVGSESTIVGFILDDEGHWIAELSCGHRQHVRHRPPYVERAWVLSETERAAKIGCPIVCGSCAGERAKPRDLP